MSDLLGEVASMILKELYSEWLWNCARLLENYELLCESSSDSRNSGVLVRLLGHGR